MSIDTPTATDGERRWNVTAWRDSVGCVWRWNEAGDALCSKSSPSQYVTQGGLAAPRGPLTPVAVDNPAALLAELAQIQREVGALRGTAQAYWAEVLELRNARKQRDEARAETARYQPATIGSGDHAGAWHIHSCGQPELWPAATGPEDGGCDACESGSPNASDWQPLYVRTPNPSERPTPKD